MDSLREDYMSLREHPVKIVSKINMFGTNVIETSKPHILYSIHFSVSVTVLEIMKQIHQNCYSVRMFSNSVGFEVLTSVTMTNTLF
jgi:hypothetical protein